MIHSHPLPVCLKWSSIFVPRTRARRGFGSVAKVEIERFSNVSRLHLLWGVFGSTYSIVASLLNIHLVESHNTVRFYEARTMSH